MFESTEQRICDQARPSRTIGWPPDLELDMIKRKIDNDVQNKDGRLEDEAWIEISYERAELRYNVEEDNNGPAVGVDDKRRDMNDAEDSNN